MSLETMINYDIIVFGFMDQGGGPYSQPYSETVQCVSQYIDLGYGVLFGHDVVGFFYGNLFGYGKITDKFGIKLGTEPCLVYGYCSQGSVSSNWNHYSNEIKVTQRGLVTDYPYHIPSGVLPINLTHTNSNAAFGDVWAELGEFDSFTYGNFTEIESYSWELDGYSELRYGNPHYYLTTYINTAMIQTGHTLASATLYERQLLVNTICYLYQHASLQYSYDNSVKPLKLNPPNIKRISGERTIEINTDNKYETEIINYKVVGKILYENVYESSPVQFNLTTYVKEYYYIIDENANTNITKDNIKGIQTTNGIIRNIKDGDLYIHVASIDNYGVLSETSHFFLAKEPSTLTFTESNTFTKLSSFPLFTSLSHSFIVSYSNSFTETIFYKSFIISSLTLTKIDSTYIYVNIFSNSYEYAIILYSTYIKLYSGFYTVYQYNEKDIQNINETNYIIIICICIVIVIVILIIIILVIYIKHKHQKNTSIEKDSDDIKEGDISSINNFSAGLTPTNTEEDPFAKDFEDDKKFYSYLILENNHILFT